MWLPEWTTRNWEFPGPIGPGRIEAGTPVKKSSLTPGDFPAQLGRAALKPDAPPDGNRRFGNFPAQLGRAALKPDSLNWPSIMPKAFPGPIGPGRIEAREQGEG